jgi:hypothetical protein
MTDMSTDPMASGASDQTEQQVGGPGYGGQAAAFSEQAGPGYGGSEQTEQQVGGPGYGGQAAAFSEQAGPGNGTPLHPLLGQRPAWSGAHGQRMFSGESHGEAPQAPVFHGTMPPPESGTPGDVPTEMHGGEPVSFAAGGGGEADYGTAAHEQPIHVSSEEPSFEDASHATATGGAGGYTEHGGGADAGQEPHHI